MTIVPEIFIKGYIKVSCIIKNSVSRAYWNAR